MLTLKLQNHRAGSTKVVECTSVDDIVSGDDHVLEVETASGKESFVVSQDGEYTVGFVENATGATTHIVRPGSRNAQQPPRRIR